MAEKKKPEEQGERKLTESKRAVRAADFKSLYLNNLQLGFTRFDFQMVLGLVEVSNDAEYTETVTETANVKMTPGFAKALLTDLMGTLQKYEEAYGEIQLPPPLK